MITSGISAKIDNYVAGVLSGDIVACKRVTQAAQRYIDDLARQNTDEFPYYFDRKWATLVCDFFPCVLKHSIGEFAGRPFELEPWQAFCIWNIFGYLYKSPTILGNLKLHLKYGLCCGSNQR